MTVKENEPLRGTSIVFDWGNTLVLDPFDDLSPRISEQASEMSKELNFDLDTESFLSQWAKANAEMIIQFSSHFSQEEPFIQEGLRQAGVPAPIRALLAPRILVTYRNAFKELLEQDPRREELEEVLTELKRRGKHLGVISNDRSFTPQSTLTWLGVADLFDHFLTSEEIGLEKPDPRVFDVASKRFGKPISDIIYVGDDPIRDVQCAHQAGAKAVLYVPPEQYRSTKSWRDYSQSPDKEDRRVEKFSDLLKVIS
ncbi:MAG: Hydrolase 2-haloalkanoic acid dehalogenase [Candidatus Levybacteria bacterium GW2011_GWA1_39_11]|nr:MAG: Hydrolase 2-haloalkanoic acid dehalogenase [Candidatus Levybacteria bacterium GW2011_GWA1_39_11]